MIMAGQAPGIRRPRIRDGCRAIGGDDVDVKIDEALAGEGAANAAHTVCGVTS